MLAWLTMVLVLGVAAATRYVPTAEELRAYFEQGQRFYASGAYDQAIEQYEHVAGSQSRLLDEKAIIVAVGEVRAPQDEVARYQIGNAYFKMAEEALAHAGARSDPEALAAARQTATALFAQARAHFLETEAVATEPELRALARSRVVTCQYRMQDYPGTIREAEILLARYPRSAHAEQALYDIGWAHWELQEHAASIAAFDTLVACFPGGYRANRALFQIGEARFALGQYAAAIEAYRRLVDSQGLERMSEREIQQMKREKLAGLVDETALDLAAKALIRIGVCYEKLGDYAAAAAGFARVAAQFADDRRLVEEAYRREADMHYNRGDFAACADVYRRAIDAQQDVAGRARMQLLLANRCFETGHYAEAIEEYNVFRYTYAELADRVGLPLAGAGLQIAKAWSGRAEAEPATAAGHHRQAELELRRTLAAWPDSPLAGELRFNLGLAVQRQGGTDRLRAALELFAGVRELAGPNGLGRSALFQIARLRAQLGESDAAAAAYRQLVAECGTAPEADIARFELGLVWRDAGAADSAVAALRAVRAESPLFARSRLEAGQLLAGREQREAALALFLEGLEGGGTDGERALLNFLLGTTHAQLGEHAEALAFFARAQTGADPELRERALYAQALAAYKLGRHPEAVALLDRQWADPEVARAARRLLAATHATLGDAAAAMAVYAALAQEAATPLEQAEFRLALAEIAYRQREYERAIAAALEVEQLAVADDSLSADRPYYLSEKAAFLAADAYTRLGDYTQARAAAQRGLADHPAGFYAADLLFLDGTAALQLGQPAAAAARLEEMARRYPEHANAPYAIYYLGYALFNQTQFARALAQFEAVVARYPDLDAAADALFRLAECHYNLEHYAEAAAAYARVIAEYPDTPLREDAMFNIAWCALNSLPAGDEHPDMTPVRRALDDYLAAYPAGRHAATALYTLGEIHFNAGEYAAAHELFSRIQRDYPGSEAALQASQFVPDVREAIAYREYSAVLEDFNRALDAEDKVLLRAVIPRLERIWEQYPTTAAGVGAKVNVGVCYQNLEEWGAAVQTFEAIIAAGAEGNEQVTPQVLGFAERRRDMIAKKHL